MLRQTAKQVKKVLWLILFANLSVALVKIIIGSMTQSASMTADGFHSLTDGVSNVVGLIGIGLASKPVDQDHPYGHKKYECITSLFIGGMLLVIAAQIIIEAIARFLEPVVPQFGMETLAALVATIIINIVVCVYEFKQGKRLNSYILISDSLHTKSDIYVSLGVLSTLVLLKLGAPPIIDPITSILVAGFIANAAINIIKSTSDILVDKIAVDEALIRTIAISFEQVIDVHEIRSRGSDGNLFIDMHIVIDAAMSIEAAHELVHAIEEKLKGEIGSHLEVMIHTEPQNDAEMSSFSPGT
jgi:cation diffusion facilitator family transporter